MSEDEGAAVRADEGAAAPADDGASAPGRRRIGVYVCHCGGNISDYVDVAEVAEAAGGETDVVVARTAMFTCSDATQQEIITDIRERGLDGLVVASCSPKLHTATFRDVARRAGLNPYQYTQVNIREQCSWAHTDDRDGATAKATGLVRAGVARTRLTTPLEPVVVQTVPKALVVGGGIAGLRAALGLAEIGLTVFVVEREPELGGWVGRFGPMYPNDRDGRAMIAGLVEEVRRHPDITVFTGAEVVGKSGSYGNYVVDVRVAGETVRVEAGSIVVATGFDTYQPQTGEFGYGTDGVLTLPEFKALLDAAEGPLTYRDRPVRAVAYIYCVGSRQPEDVPDANVYCSRYCCSATVHTSLQVASKGMAADGSAAGGPGAGGAGVRQYHCYREMRSYGRNELLYGRSREQGSVYLRFADDDPPTVERDAASGALTVTVRDQLAGGAELQLPVDLVVLVTGMVPRGNDDLVSVLKVPIGRDGFLNEIHPKLRPVETVVDGVNICGACQGPKSSTESVASALAAVTQSGAVLKQASAELDPLVATVDPAACTWCGRCLEACPYAAVAPVRLAAATGAGGGDLVAVGNGTGGREVAVIDEAGCKGCGGCVPICPQDAIDLRGYTDGQVRAMIDGLLGAVR